MDKCIKIETKCLTPRIIDIILNITVGKEYTLLPPQLQFTDKNYTGYKSFINLLFSGPPFLEEYGYGEDSLKATSGERTERFEGLGKCVFWQTVANVQRPKFK